jgi:hypothetical protein
MGSFVDKFLFRRYVKLTSMQAVATLASPTLKLVDFITQGGDSVSEPCILDGPEGFSFDFDQAQLQSEARGASDYEQWNSTFGEYFGSVKISARAIAGAKGKEDAFLRQLTEIMDSGLKKFGHLAARKYLGPTGSFIGTASTTSTGTAGDPGVVTGGTARTIVLDDPKLAIHWAKDMRVQVTDNGGAGAGIKGATALNSGGVLTVATVNLSAGIITFTNTAGDLTYSAAYGAATDGTAIFYRAGDVPTTTNEGLIMRPLGAWNPLVAVVGTADSFNNVDRGVHELLSGSRATASEVQGLSIKERIEFLVNKMRNTAGAYDTTHVALHGNAWLALSQDIQAHGWLSFGKTLEIGAGELVIQTPNGLVKVINDPHMPIGDIRVLSEKDMKCYNYDGFPGYAEEEGLRMVKMPNKTNYEVRYQCFSNFTVNGRPWNFGIAPSGMS